MEGIKRKLADREVFKMKIYQNLGMWVEID